MKANLDSLPVMMLLAAHLAAPARAATFIVPGDFATIQEAIDAEQTAGGDEIVLVASRYTGAGNRDLDFGGKAITLRSAAGDPSTCRIDCEEAGRGFVFRSGETRSSRVVGIEVYAGVASEGGAMICTGGSAPVIADCAFRSCAAASSGGAVASIASAPSFVNCLFAANGSGGFGGAMSNLLSDAEISGCSFEGNLAIGLGSGGALYNANSNPRILDCRFTGNVAVVQGGGMYSVSSEPIVRRCTFAENTAPRGGGVFNTGGGAELTDCTFDGNLADGGAAIFNSTSVPVMRRCLFRENAAGVDGGGAMRNVSAMPTLINCVFVANTATNRGAAIANLGGAVPVLESCTLTANVAGKSAGAMDNDVASSATVSNSILWGNEPTEVFDPGGAMVVRYCDVAGGWSGSGAGNIDEDPRLVGAMGTDPRLGPGSPCIDAGDNAAVPAGTTTDFDGNPRFFDDPDTADTGLGTPPIVDIGAIEFQSCSADVDGDGDVGFADLLAVLSAWGPCPGCPADIDDSGDVSFADLLRVLSTWGTCSDS